MMRKICRASRLALGGLALLMGTTSCTHWPPASIRMIAEPLVCNHLRCEMRTNPLGVDEPAPRLSWVVQSSRRGQRQTAYRIEVASDRDRLLRGEADLWDTGRVASAQSIQRPYAGRPLRPRQRCWWRVRAWGADGQPSPWSEPAMWEMGLLDAKQWQGQWIGDGRPDPATEADFFKDDPAPLFRKTFSVTQPIRQARLYITGLGYYQATVNGRPVGSRLLDPLWTDYAHRIYYSVFDVTEQVQTGHNVLGVTLGNGWYNPLPLRMWGRINLREHLVVGRPRLRAQLEITGRDGSRMVIASDETWRVTEGPLLRNNIYLGERYDARRQRPGWDRPGFDATDWHSAKIAEAPGGRLVACPAPPIRTGPPIRPVRFTQPKPGVYVIDFGRNFTGLVRMRVKGPAGTRVTLRYGELLYNDGTVNVMTGVCGQIKHARKDKPWVPAVAEQSDVYILRGGATEQYRPTFTFHGFRYVEVTGLPRRPKRSDFIALPLHCDLKPVGRFTCSNRLFNDIERMVQRTFLSNVMGVQSDCPHRERFGYGGDIVVTAPAFLLHYDMAAFYAKVVQDFTDAARPNGGLTETAPFVGVAAGGFGQRSGPIGWGLVHPLLMRQLYRYYGDRRLIEQHYDTARRWVELIRSQSPDHLVRRGIGDHESLARTPVAVTGTAFYYRTVRLLSELADILGRTDEANEYHRLAQSIRQSFIENFVHDSPDHPRPDTQTAYALSLDNGLFPDGGRDDQLARLVDRLGRDGNHLTTGIFGTQALLNVLSGNGRADLAGRLVDQRDWPGWAYMLDHGATTLWEHWKFSDNTFSHNHPMFGSVSEWMMRHVAGISPAPQAVGFDRIIVHPRLNAGLKWARGDYDSVRGPVACHWRISGRRLRLRVLVPVGSTATVYVPTPQPGAVTESGRPASRSPGCRALAPTADAAVFQVQSGAYSFEAPLAGPVR